MRLILEIISGSEKGRKTRLAANQCVIVGRTEWADFVIPTDARISSKHFSLTADHETCHLSDLGSSNGTYVNGKKISEVVLQDGDLVLAGETEFAVRLNEPTAGATVEIKRPAIATLRSSPASSEPLPAGSEIQVKIAASGLHHAQCGTEPLPPRELLDRIDARLSGLSDGRFQTFGYAGPGRTGRSGPLIRLAPGSCTPRVARGRRSAGLARRQGTARVGLGKGRPGLPGVSARSGPVIGKSAISRPWAWRRRVGILLARGVVGDAFERPPRACQAAAQWH